MDINLSLVAKLGSIIVHIEEMLSPKGHKFDVIALKGLMNDFEVQELLKKLKSMALIPEKR